MNWIRIIAVAAVVAIVVLTVGAWRRAGRRIDFLRAPFFFWLGILYLVILLTLATMYQRNDFSLQDELGGVIGGVLPIGVPWAGALGAVMISLQGVFKYNTRWNPKYNYWHLARPVFGAVLAIVAFFIYVLILRAAGEPPEFITNADVQPKPIDLIVFNVVGFLVGYREETFRELIRRATDLILQPGGPPATPESAVTFEQDGAAIRDLDFGTVSGPFERSVTVRNTGKAALTSPTAEVTTVQPEGSTAFAITSNGLAGADLPPSAGADLKIKFEAERGVYRGTLTVNSPALADPAILELRGERGG